MPGKPIATVTSMHTCPMVNGTVPHVGGPVVGPGAPNVLVNGKPAALMGDTCTCTGPPDTIIQGNPSVMINGTPVATLGSMTAHGGSIVMGEPTVMISTSTPSSSVSLPLREIKFPKITTLDLVVAVFSGRYKALKEAKKNIEETKEEAKNHGFLPDVGFSQ